MVKQIRHIVMVSVIALLPLASAAVTIPNTALPSRVGERLSGAQDLDVAKAAPVSIGKPVDQAPFADAKKVKFVLKKITIEGNTVISSDELKPLYSDKLNQRISLADLQNIAHAVTIAYRDRGYILSQALIPPQKIKHGAVRLQIIEGYIENVLVKGKVTRGTDNLLYEYGSRIAMQQPIHMENLERYALLANDLPGIIVESVITPSKTTPGAADLTFVVQQKRVEVFGIYDNRSTRLLGPQELTAGLYVNGLLRGSKTGFRAVSSTDFSEMQYYEFMHQQPLGSNGWLMRLFVDHVRTKPDFTDIGQPPLDNRGKSTMIITQLLYPVIRSRRQNLFVHGVFDVTNSSTDFFDTRLFDDRIRSLRFGVSYDRADTIEGLNLITFELSQGLNIFGERKTGSANLSRPEGSSDYTKFNLSLSRLQHFPRQFSFLLGMSGQYAFNPLLSAEQFGYGGVLYGRGYDPSEILGDSGIDGKAEFRYDYLPKRFYLAHLQFFIFYDVGVVWNRDKATQPARASGASTGGGLRFDFTNYLQGEVFYGKPLTRIVANERDKDGRVFFTITAYN